MKISKPASRVLALLMAAFMLFGMLPVSAFAAETHTVSITSAKESGSFENATIAVGDTLIIELTNGSTSNPKDYTVKVGNGAVAQVLTTASFELAASAETTVQVKGLAAGTTTIVMEGTSSNGSSTYTATINLTVTGEGGSGDGDQGGTETPPATGKEVALTAKTSNGDAKSESIAVGEELTVKLTNDSSSEKTYTVTNSDSGAASVAGSVKIAGKGTEEITVTGLANGRTTITFTASSSGGGSYTATLTLTVGTGVSEGGNQGGDTTEAKTVEITASSSGSATTSAEIEVGQTLKIKLTNGSSNNSKNYTTAVGNTQVAEIVSGAELNLAKSATGEIIVRGTRAGTTTIVSTSDVGSGSNTYTATINLTVVGEGGSDDGDQGGTENPPAAGKVVELAAKTSNGDSKSESIAVGEKLTVKLSNGSGSEKTYSVTNSDPAAASVVSSIKIAGNGTGEIPVEGLANGKTTITFTASSNSGGSYTATLTLTVGTGVSEGGNQGGDTTEAKTVEITASSSGSATTSAEIEVGQTLKIKLTNGSSNNAKNYTTVVNDTQVAEIVSGAELNLAKSATGEITVRGVRAGTTTIVSTSDVGSGSNTYTATINLTVTGEGGGTVTPPNPPAPVDPPAGGKVVVISGSDYQSSYGGGASPSSTMTSLMNRIKTNHGDAYGILMGGDYSAGMPSSHNDVVAVNNDITGVYPNLVAGNRIFVQGNHDSGNSSNLITATGAHDTDYYGVYSINYSDFNNAASGLESYLNGKSGSQPIFVITHQPLHASSRNDNNSAVNLFRVINAAGARGLNIIFLFGHNHSSTYDDYLGGGAIYLKKGDSIKVAGGSTETLNFTYMNCGYVGYSNSRADNALTMTAFEITSDNVTIKRYDTNGLHNLKAKGVGSGNYTADTNEYGYAELSLSNGQSTIKSLDGHEHTYGAVSYSGDGKTSYAATRACACGNTQTVTAAITSEVTTPATCIETGVRTYYANFAEEWAEDKTTTETIPANGKHNYENGECTVCGAEEPDEPVEPSEPAYTRVETITSGEQYVIVAGNKALDRSSTGSAMDDSNTVSYSGYEATDVTIVGNQITSAVNANMIWTVEATTGGYYIKAGNQYLKADYTRESEYVSSLTMTSNQNDADSWSYQNYLLGTADNSNNCYLTVWNNDFFTVRSNTTDQPDNVYFYLVGDGEIGPGEGGGDDPVIPPVTPGSGHNIGFASDVHTNTTGFSTWFTAVNNKLDPDLEAMAFGGDYATNGSESAGVINTLRGILGNTHSIFTTGNHEYYYNYTPNSPYLTKVGLADNSDAYDIFCFGAAGWYTAEHTFHEEDVDALEDYLEGAPADQPIFILSHFPLHYNGSRYATNAAEVIDLLNDYPNVIFLWGHNHSQSDANYGKIVTANNSIEIARGTNKTINFTYASNGTIGDNYSQGVRALVANVSDDSKSVTLTYYDLNANVVSSADNKTITIETAVHNHTDADGKWESDGTNHWHTCRCGEILDFAAHTVVVDNAADPTCTESGMTEGKHCSVCSEILVAQVEIPALGHNWNQGEVITEPAEGKDGLARYTCLTCGATEDRIIPAPEHNHVYDSVVTRATCTEQGYTTHTCSCGYSYIDNYTEPLGHTKVTITGKAATCTETGLTDGTECVICGAVLVAQKEIPALGHTEETVPGKAATCTEDGLTEGKYCSVCNEVLAVQEVIVALGHTEVVDPAVAATCTESGLTEGKHCSVCNEVLVAQEVVAALGHTEVVDPAVAPTCTETGLTEGKHCSVCGETLVAQEEIPALGHDWKGTGCTRCDATRVNPFTDVPEDSFYIDPVLWAVENGITTGATSTTFDPNGDCLRGQVVTFLWRAAGEPEPTTSNNPFTDVKETDFFYKAVLWAVEKGITNGTTATTFSPYQVCNRAQVVTFLWRAAGEPQPTSNENPFSDVVVNDFYGTAVLWAVENGITNGMGDGTFGVLTTCNRAQVVTFLYRMYIIK